MPTQENSQLLGHSPDVLAQRQDALLQFVRDTLPELMSDNQLDLHKLKAWLDDTDAAAPSEHYELSWAGKTDARREVQKTTSHTLRPSANNPAQAGHMLIEGENLEVLRVLQRSYYGKVKMIYIDPPYNTGNDSFVYPDDYSETLDEYQKRTGEKNESGYLNKQSLWKKNSKERLRCIACPCRASARCGCALTPTRTCKTSCICHAKPCLRFWMAVNDMS